MSDTYIFTQIRSLPHVYTIQNGFHYYPFQDSFEPQISVKLDGNPVIGILDSGAQIYVAPHTFLAGLGITNIDSLPSKQVRVFGGTPLSLQGPVPMIVEIGNH